MRSFAPWPGACPWITPWPSPGARIYCRIWDPNEAQKVLTRFVAGDSTDRWSRLALATSLRLTDRLDEAEKVLLPLPGSDPDALVIRIRIALDRGEIEAAEELVRQGPETHAGLNLLRGELALHGADPRRAAVYFRAVLGSNPDDRDALHGLGTVLRKLGDREAERYLEIASRQDLLKRTILDSVTTIRTNPKLFYQLGEMCESVNRREEARTWYQLAIGRDPLDSQAQQALARLGKKPPRRAPSRSPGRIRRTDDSTNVGHAPIIGLSMRPESVAWIIRVRALPRLSAGELRRRVRSRAPRPGYVPGSRVFREARSSLASSIRRSSRSGSTAVATVRKALASNPRPSRSASRAISAASRTG